MNYIVSMFYEKDVYKCIEKNSITFLSNFCQITFIKTLISHYLEIITPLSSKTFKVL